jgi:hypothetical protein
MCLMTAPLKKRDADCVTKEIVTALLAGQRMDKGRTEYLRVNRREVEEGEDQD